MLCRILLYWMESIDGRNHCITYTAHCSIQMRLNLYSTVGLILTFKSIAKSLPLGWFSSKNLLDARALNLPGQTIA